jgi:hypothetical protein
MFLNLVDFNKATKNPRCKVICLTATAYDGHEEGNERKALELLGYQIYNYSKVEPNYQPIINKTADLITTEEYIDFVHKTAAD